MHPFYIYVDQLIQVGNTYKPVISILFSRGTREEAIGARKGRIQSMNRYYCPSIVTVFFIVASIFCAGCAHDKKAQQTNYPEGVAFDQPYDKVWAAINDLLFTDLGCAEKKTNKSKGLIETEWVTQITTDGTMRWKVSATLKKQGDKTRVILSKNMEMREELSNSPYRSKEKEREKDKHPDAGWKHTEISADSIDSLYQQLQNKLK